MDNYVQQGGGSMKRLLSLLPSVGALAGALLVVTALAVPPNAMAQACKVDQTDGSCKNAGKVCSPPTGGRCKTGRALQQFTCNCVVPGPTPPGSEAPQADPSKGEKPPPEEKQDQPPQAETPLG